MGVYYFFPGVLFFYPSTACFAHALAEVVVAEEEAELFCQVSAIAGFKEESGFGVYYSVL